ncbi:hypothetical protein GO755_11700 [Spirosoma sp. HMF4905]|uniref:Uncharacterized protein n=1 Tax=Spirosoma arboris TaxID=2682092 RepID=A0A7K1SA62_9BACT|nr:hypothetical protein [Spirosoma arboris]MVM30697.1 hypothetical protein [Spirosoma arboris]
MKTQLMLLALVCLLPISLYAQHPLSATLTNPSSLTIKFDPKKKLPPLSLSCKLTNGKDRPYACEFSFDKLEFYGNDGSLLGTVKPLLNGGQPNFTQLPFLKAKKSAPAGQTGQITYTVKAYFTRRNKPSFPVNKGYQIRSCKVTSCLPSDEISTVLSAIAMPVGINDQAILTFDLSWIYGKKDGLMLGPHELYIENDVTTTKFALSAQNPLRDRAEAWIDIRPVITGDPSPTN